MCVCVLRVGVCVCVLRVCVGVGVYVGVLASLHAHSLLRRILPTQGTYEHTHTHVCVRLCVFDHVQYGRRPIWQPQLCLRALTRDPRESCMCVLVCVRCLSLDIHLISGRL